MTTLFNQVLDYIVSHMVLLPGESYHDNGSGYSTMIYTNDDPQDPMTITVQLFRDKPVQITAVVRDVQVATVLYTSDKLPGAFQLLIPKFL